MRLSELMPDSGEDIEVRGLCSDSREVEPGFLFAALAGTHADGADFVTEAIARGAVAVLTRPEASLDAPGVRVIADPDPRRRLAHIAARFYATQPRIIAAVTGTNGKTSVASFTRQVWQGMGHAAASVGTLGVEAPGYHARLTLTTPDPIELHGVLAELSGRGVEHLAMEASSHGLDQRRLDGVRLSAAALTNISRDHLDYHPDPMGYSAAKRRLFEELLGDGVAVLNADDESFEALALACKTNGQRIIGYGRKGAEIRLIARSEREDGQEIRVEVGGQVHEALVPLPGGFQVDNALCALGLAWGCGGEVEPALAALEGLRGVRGRLEAVAHHPSGAPIYVDYAHTPDALEHALDALRSLTPRRLVVVFGCGGERDRGKRAEMGAIAAARADRVIVTDDNPRREDPAAIRRDILAACPAADEIGDRAAAIAAAVGDLETGDVLVLAGKGHEEDQTVGDAARPFDDAEIARLAVAEAQT
jgi:UDP-N-acetylmuramoyl-L-alanyl-D-glutamate--2,6-diaminopimelate ligase